MLVDDHDIVLYGLEAVFQNREDVEVVGTASTQREAVETATRLHPDVVLMDVRLQSGSGIEATRIIRADMPDVRVLMLTSHVDHDAFRNCLEAGANGFLLKTADRQRLVDGVRSVAGGSALHDPLMLAELVGAKLDLAPEALNAREVEIVDLMVDGQSNRAIAERLCVSEKTVKNGATAIFKKLGVRNRNEAIRLRLAAVS